MKTDPAQSFCPTCGEPFKGKYCHNCGEKKLTDRDFSIKALVGEVFSDFDFLNNKLFITLKLLLINPGMYFSDYLKGKRKPYLKPIQLFLIANALYFFAGAFNSFMTPLETQRSHQPYSFLVQGQIESTILESDLSPEAFEQSFNQKTTSLSKSILIIFVFFHAISTSLFFLRKKVPFISIFQFSLILISFFLMILFIALPTIIYRINLFFNFDQSLLSDANYTFFLFFAMLSYTYFLLRPLVKESKISSLVKAAGMTFSFLIITFIYRLVLLQLTLIWM